MLNTEYNGTHSWLLEYISKCRLGEIIVGHEIQMEFDRILEDFNDPSIKVEFEDAHKRIKFIETKCKHSEAPFAGKPFILELFQKAFIESIYIFKVFDEELGRYVRLIQEVLFVVARKNGKTPLIGAMCLSEWFCGDMGLKILCSSNDYEQADLMFQAINNMREESPSLERVTRKNIKGIYFGNPRKPKKKGKFSYQNKGSIRKISAKTGAKEGRNIGVGAVDEVHELQDNSSIMPIRQALSTQDEPLYLELTTDGFVNDGYLDERLSDARKVLKRDMDRRRWRIWLFTQDNEQEIWQDEKSWYKSNPGLGVIKKWSFLRQMVEEAKTSKKTRAFVLAKDFNIKQNNAAAWLSAEQIENEETFDLGEFRNGFAIGAVDLSKSGDLANARIMLMKKDSPKKYFYTHYFIPESKIDNLPVEDVDNFKEWINKKLITVSPGNENDFRFVTQWFYELYKNYNIRTYLTGYDKWSAIYWVKEMEEDYGFDCKRINQDFDVFTDPMEMLERDLTSKLVVYNNNPIDKWCLENTALKINSKGKTMPTKIQGKEDKKIDGTVTMIMCYKIYLDNKTEYLELVNRAG